MKWKFGWARFVRPSTSIGLAYADKEPEPDRDAASAADPWGDVNMSPDSGPAQIRERAGCQIFVNFSDCVLCGCDGVVDAA